MYASYIFIEFRISGITNTISYLFLFQRDEMQTQSKLIKMNNHSYNITWLQLLLRGLSYHQYLFSRHVPRRWKPTRYKLPRNNWFMSYNIPQYTPETPRYLSSATRHLWRQRVFARSAATWQCIMINFVNVNRASIKQSS